jgi:GDP-L-fucose synthase
MMRSEGDKMKRMEPSQRVFVAGHRGLVGSSFVRALSARGYHTLVLRTRDELDLRRQADVERLFESQRPDVVILAAAKVGGILANQTARADFIAQNLLIQTNVIMAAHTFDVERLLFLGSSCIYPRHCPQPMREEHLLTGTLEPTNEPYAVAKIAGLKLCEALNQQYNRHYLSVMPTNLYGPYDNFDLHTSHVLPALIRRIEQARREGVEEVVLWGSGSPLREFLHVDDLASACLFLLEQTDERELINIGSGQEVSIRELAELIAKLVGYRGRFVQDTSKPDGTPRKLLDTSRLSALGWRPAITLEQGIAQTLAWWRSVSLMETRDVVRQGIGVEGRGMTKGGTRSA